MTGVDICLHSPSAYTIAAGASPRDHANSCCELLNARDLSGTCARKWLSAAAANFADSTSYIAFLCMQVALAAGKRTAWIDKGPYYEVVQVRLHLPV